MQKTSLSNHLKHEREIIYNVNNKLYVEKKLLAQKLTFWIFDQSQSEWLPLNYFFTVIMQNVAYGHHVVLHLRYIWINASNMEYITDRNAYTQVILVWISYFYRESATTPANEDEKLTSGDNWQNVSNVTCFFFLLSNTYADNNMCFGQLRSIYNTS